MRAPRLVRQLVELREVLGLLAPYLRRHRRTMLVGLVLTTLLLPLRLAAPWPLKWIVDGLTGSGPQIVSPGAAGLLFLLLTAGAAATEYAQVMVLVALGNNVLYTFRTDLFAHVLRQPLAFHERRNLGELLTRVMYDTTRLRKGLNQVLTRVLQTVLTFVAVVLVVFWVDAVLASVLALAGMAAFALVLRGGYRVRAAARKNRRREGKLAALVADELVAIREVQAFRPGAGGEAFERLSARSLKQESKVRRLSSGMVLQVELIFAAGLALVLLLGAGRVEAGAISAGDLVIFVSYATALFPPVLRFARQSARMGATVASADRLCSLMRRRPDIADAPDAIDPGHLRGEVELRGVAVRNARRRRGSRKWALRDVDLRLNSLERTAVLGTNGAGKSTLLRLLLRLVDPQVGEVRIDGRDVRDYRIAGLRGQISTVFQDSVLFGVTVRENLALARPDATEADILDALAKAQALELIERLPQGLDTVVHRQGRLLSSGERQRLAIARALLRDGSVWLLDEPATGLDASTAEQIERVLEEATRGRTTLWVSHDPRTAYRLERTLYLVDGWVRFHGTHEEFIAWAGASAPGALLLPT